MTGLRLMVIPAVLILIIIAAGIGWLAGYGLLTLVRMITG